MIDRGVFNILQSVVYISSITVLILGLVITALLIKPKDGSAKELKPHPHVFSYAPDGA